MEKFFKILLKRKVTPNELQVLWLIRESGAGRSWDEISGMVDSAQLEPMLIRLCVNGYLDKKENLYFVTDKGDEFIVETSNLFEGQKGMTNVELFVERFRNLFPKGGHGTKPFRTHPGDLTPRFKWFFKEYPMYTQDVVLEATKRYIQAFNEIYDYMQVAGYFIKKQDAQKISTSNLATWCQLVMDGNFVETSAEQQTSHMPVRA